MKKHFPPLSRKYSFRIIMTLAAHFNPELHQMDVKTFFFNCDIKEEIYITLPEGLQVEGKVNICVSLKDQYIDLNKSFDNNILSLMILLLPMNLRKTPLIGVYILRLVGASLYF